MNTLRQRSVIAISQVSRSLAFRSRPLSTKSNSGESVRKAILDRALEKVKQNGWSTKPIIEASKDLGYTPAVHGIVQNGEIDLLDHFFTTAKNSMVEQTKEQIATSPSTHDKLSLLFKARLEQTIPYLPHWPQACGILAQPQNLLFSSQKLGSLADEIRYLSGDKCTNVDWYVRRGSVAAAYLATELYMCEDRSPGYQNTWDFMNKQIENMTKVDDAMYGVSGYAAYFGRNLYNMLASVSPFYN